MEIDRAKKYELIETKGKDWKHSQVNEMGNLKEK